MIYTEKEQGVLPEYDIRTDKWEIAQNAMDVVHATNIAKSKELSKENKEEKPVERYTQEQQSTTTPEINSHAVRMCAYISSAYVPLSLTRRKRERMGDFFKNMASSAANSAGSGLVGMGLNPIGGLINGVS